VQPKTLAGCAYAIATDSPFHVALGSLAPQNGFGFGAAFDESYTPNESWRLSWNADAVGAPSGAWRAGVYMKLIHMPPTSGVVVRPPGEVASGSPITPRELPVIDLFAQTISLKTLGYFGEGRTSIEAGRSVYGERETTAGVSAVYPVGLAALSALHPALIGGINGRFVSIRPGVSNDVPSIEQLYDEAGAPGVDRQRPFLELGEAIRFKPSALHGWLRFNYRFAAQQFRSSRESLSSFNRWTIDLQHEIPLYRNVSSSGPSELNGPDACTQSVESPSCPPVRWSRNREGAIGLRLLMVASTAADGDRVPFYFQPTLGGSDINGERLLAGYQDYRFRAPNLLALQETFEHTIWGPIGAFALAEQGRVATNRGDLGFHQLAKSTTIGVTLRAGGFPMVHLSWSWSREGHHLIGAMDSTLLGGSPRPSLF
jgi:hypothetical protein